MDFLEIMTEVRNMTGLHTENDLGTQELMRYINSAYFKNVLLKLGTEFRKDTYKQSELDDQTGDTVSVPADAEVVVDVERGGYPCVECPYEDKSKIGIYKGEDILQYPDDDTKHPVYVNQGSTLYIRPALSDTDVVVGYLPKTPQLIYGKGTISSTTLSLDDLASTIDDIYNGYEIALYSLTAVTMTLKGIYTVSDYTGGDDRQITLSSAPSNGTYYYALVPKINEFFHTLIAQATLIELAKANYYSYDPGALLSEYLITLKETRKDYRLYSR